MRAGRALVIGDSGGIGGALAAALARRGAAVEGLSRSRDGLDLCDEASVAAALARLEGPYETILVATGALEIAGARPEKSLAEVTPEGLSAQFRLNALGPLLVLKGALRLLPRQGRSVFGVLSARVGSIGDNRLGGWYGYRAAKAALNQLMRSAAIEIARTHPQAICVCLHPGTVRTDFTRRYLGRHPAVEPGEAAANLLRVIDGLTPEDTGSFHDWKGERVPW
jgi:NAD(P)-dependent dehydrogenase (short-subunit alcohol dehydrogenase family)